MSPVEQVDLSHLSAPAGGSRRLNGHLARPADPGPRPGVVVVHEYPQAGHSFLNDAEVGPRPLRPLFRVMGMGPDPEAAADAWRRVETFFATHLNTPHTEKAES
ncbi:dienelactone hydrolase family protein [Streptomyces sp. NPDC091217]|uniref:dienelactone hydrolase family protein n=1 Tax=Streptomyces sp. NPDC091217 TaxID=3365975 RepID=UPI00380F85F4